ncbi:MAG TPA: protein kinase [Chthoniobacterales bacterium]|jgi:serine/threonine protein kinase
MENKIFLDRYRLSLGRNGLPVELHRTPRGVTYRGQEIDSGREIALELIPWTSADAEATARLQAEAEAAKEINQINIPMLYDFGIENDQLVYVTDYFDGHSAEAWVAARGPLPLRAVLRIAMQVSAALSAASFRRIHHPALNPANIIFVPGQTAEGDWPAIKVLHWLGPAPDFSTTESAGARSDAAVRFASPEQRRGEEVDFAATVYSLGCTMWFLLTGAPPAATPALSGGKTMRARVEKLRGVPKIVRHLLGRMLRRNPAERPHDPVVLEAFLQTCLARIERRAAVSRRFGLPAASQARAVAAHQWPAKSPWAIAALLLLLASLLTVAWSHIRHPRSRRLTTVSTRQPTPPVVRQYPTPTPVTVESTSRLTTEAPPMVSPAPTTATIASTEPAAKSPSAISDSIAIQQAAETSPVGGDRVTPAPPPLTMPDQKITEASAPKGATETTALHAPQTSPATTIATIVSNTATGTAPAAPAPEKPARLTTPDKEAAEASAPAEGLAPILSPTPFAPQNLSEPSVATTATSDRVAVPQPAETAVVPAMEVPNTPHRAVAFQTSPRPKKKVVEEVTARSSKRIAKETARRSSHTSGERVVHVTVRRGRKVPPLHVGSSRAELVGTTSDGRWILSVASSGRRIIVPPPPGFGP